MGLVRHGPNLNISGPKGLSLSLREFQSNLGCWETRFRYNWPNPTLFYGRWARVSIWRVWFRVWLGMCFVFVIAWRGCVSVNSRVKSENLGCACWLLFPHVFVVLSWFVSSVYITRCCLRVLEKQSWCREMLSKECWFFFFFFGGQLSKKNKQWMLCLSNVLWVV